MSLNDFLPVPVGRKRDVQHSTSINAYRPGERVSRIHRYCHHSELKNIENNKIRNAVDNDQKNHALTFLSLTFSIKYFPLKYIFVILGL